MEGQQVAALLSVEPWLGQGVLEGRLKAGRSPRILHIATHGFFLPDQERDPNKDQLGLGVVDETAGDRLGQLSNVENPLLRSGLALAGANTWLKGDVLPKEAEDGILTAEDVSGLDLLATELVVLSACETGLGQVQVGEGVFGLRRAFVLAGAKTLVMSLWKVPDQQTQELMVGFYRRILTGQPRSDALRGAQLAMKAKYANPLYWGAFICQGDPGPLPGYRHEAQP
jgi:CHAT domain-containing protein